MNEMDPIEPNDFPIDLPVEVAYGVPLMPLPGSLKSRLMERLGLPVPSVSLTVDTPLSELLDWSLENLIAEAASLTNWRPFPKPQDSTWAIWKTDAVNRQVAFFLRVPGSGALPTHYHETGEVVLVLDGDFSANGIQYHVGDRMVSAAGTTHQPRTTGCLVLCVSSMDDRPVEAIV
jgi:ChrR Cupin-like domain